MTTWRYEPPEWRAPRYFYFTQYTPTDCELFITVSEPEITKKLLGFYDVYLGVLGKNDWEEFLEIIAQQKEGMILDNLQFLWNTFAQSRENQSE